MPETYEHVFQPIQLGTCTIRNRIYQSALTTNFAHDSRIGERHLAFLAERSRGGLGLIFTEALEVHPTGLAGPERLHVADDVALQGLRAIADAVHDGGAKLFAQLTHSGYTLEWAPSPIAAHPWNPTPHAMNAGEVELLVDCFRTAGERIVSSGLDGIEVHLGHGHLLHRFLSPTLNQRDDEYGGSEERRARLPLRVLGAVREAVGPDFPLGIRISSDELTELGPSLDEMQRIVARVLGEVDMQFVDISQSGAGIPGLQLPDMSYGPTPFLDRARAYAAVVADVPILTACRFTELVEAEATLAGGAIAMVGMSRAHIADPALLMKARAGREHEIRPCVACNFCAAQTARGESLSCMINPSAGREREWAEPIEKAAESRSVLVVGGGPAGLEFARVSAERGHRVSLWEQSDMLGGKLRVARRGVGRSDLGKLGTYLRRELTRLGVATKLGTTATSEALEQAEADVVVFATGARAPALAPVALGDVPDSDELLRVDAPEPGLTVILDYESGWRAASAIETAARRGPVCVVTPHDRLLTWINAFTRGPLLSRLADARVDVLLMHEPTTLDGRTLTLRSRSSGRQTTLEGVARIYQTTPAAPADELSRASISTGRRSLTVGDARVAGNLLSTIYDAHQAARAI